MGWPVYQKSVRASSASVPPTRPNDHGMRRTSISAARPTDAMVHIANVTSDMNAASGVRTPGCPARQARQLRTRFRVTSQLPDSASVARTDEVMRRAEEIARQTPGVKHTVAIAGQSLLLGANSSNFGS